MGMALRWYCRFPSLAHRAAEIAYSLIMYGAENDLYMLAGISASAMGSSERDEDDHSYGSLKLFTPVVTPSRLSKKQLEAPQQSKNLHHP